MDDVQFNFCFFSKFPTHYSNDIIQQPATSRNHLGNDLQTKDLRRRNSHPLGVRTVPRRWALWRRRQGQARPTTLHLSERRKCGRMATRTLANGMHEAEECIYKYYHMLSSYATYPYDCYDIRHMIKECNNCYGALKLRLKTYSQLTYCNVSFCPQRLHDCYKRTLVKCQKILSSTNFRAPRWPLVFIFALRGALNQKMILSQKISEIQDLHDRLRPKGYCGDQSYNDLSPRSNSPEKPPALGKITILLDFENSKTFSQQSSQQDATAIFQHLSHGLPPAENVANLGGEV